MECGKRLSMGKRTRSLKVRHISLYYYSRKLTCPSNRSGIAQSRHHFPWLRTRLWYPSTRFLPQSQANKVRLYPLSPIKACALTSFIRRRGGEGAYTDPYRLYNLDVFEYDADSEMAIVCSHCFCFSPEYRELTYIVFSTVRFP